jgi:hypothetical protein
VRTLLAGIALLVAGVTACHRNDNAEKLAALESAYQSGVFTKEEYAAKRAALVGTPKAVGTPQAVPSPLATPPPPAPTPQAPDVPKEATAPPVRPTRPPSVPARNQEPDTEPAPTAGCEESSGDREKGVQERFYPAPVDAVKKAAEAALEKLDFTIHKDTSRDIEATKRRHIGALVGAGGERMLLRFEKARRGNQTGTLVQGETRKNLVGRLAQKSWTNAVLAQIGCQLRIR